MSEQKVPFLVQEIYCDIDGTLTKETEGYGDSVYAVRTPDKDMIEIINFYHKKGNNITLYTSRHEEDRGVTVKWLEKYGVKYHKLIMDKPKYDILICDKTVHPVILKNTWGKIL